MNILRNLKELTDFEYTDSVFCDQKLLLSGDLGVYLIVIEGDLIRADFLEELPSNLNRLIFLSKHASESKIPCLLVHFPGNWTTDNSMGGKPRELSIADPEILKEIAMRLHQCKLDGLIPKGYQVGLEVTHHGPTINRACTFVEIGSDIESWENPHLGRIVAEAIIDSIRNLKPAKIKAKLGFGGPHYSPKFWSVLTNMEDVLIAHIAPKYVIDYLDRDIIKKAADKSLIPVDGVLLDWKGLTSQQRASLMQIFNELNLTHVRV